MNMDNLGFIVSWNANVLMSLICQKFIVLNLCWISFEMNLVWRWALEDQCRYWGSVYQNSCQVSGGNQGGGERWIGSIVWWSFSIPSNFHCKGGWRGIVFFFLTSGNGMMNSCRTSGSSCFLCLGTRISTEWNLNWVVLVWNEISNWVHLIPCLWDIFSSSMHFLGRLMLPSTRGMLICLLLRARRSCKIWN